MLTSTRYQIPYPNPDRSDIPDIPLHIGNLVTAIEKSTMFNQGLNAAKPVSTGGSPGIQGRFYYATDTGVLWYDYGTGWVPLFRTVFDPTIWLSAAGMWPTLTGGASSNTQITVGASDIYVIDFSDSVSQSVQINFPLPWDFPSGGVIQARFIWAGGSSNTGNVIWGIQLGSLADNEALGSAFGTIETVTDANNGSNKMNISAWTPDIPLASTSNPGEICFVYVYRDGAAGGDTHTAIARLLGVQLKYIRAT
jgi:hypothetical protein